MTYPHLLLLILINAAWGLNFVAGKIGTEVFGPLLFSTARFAIVLLLLLPFLRRVPGQMSTILWVGLTLGAGHYTLMFYGLHLAGSLSSVAIAVQLTVPFSTILAIVFLKERVALIRAAAIAMSFAGVVVIGFAPMGAEHVYAMCLVTLAALAMAIAAILMRRLSGVGVFNLQAWIAIVATISLALATWIFESPSYEHIISISLADYWSPLYSAVGATIFGHGSLYFLLQRYAVTHVAPLTSSATLFGIAFSLWLLDDQLTLQIFIGGILTLFGVTIIAIRNARRSTPSSLRVPR
ncbi:hypothetical protein AB833_23545 [Chromatiales bacterium (ex Bugula neritina AB1)]|nr:hypothetical protein AB833_23545 [Chromatiales bacterium (ex Bugula neritina AB1)]